MNKLLTQGRISFLIVFLVLIIDQIIKISVKTSMYFHESIRVSDWFYIYFTENNGMAFGMEIFGKLFLTSFRIVAVGVIIYYLCRIIRKGTMKTGFVVCLSLILAGAAGNIIDSVFYGMIFSESTPFEVARLVPWGEGYTDMFYGKVVDMFYFPIIDTYWPGWLPVIGGDRFIFFSPIFNFADAAISCGIIAMLLFYGNYLNNGNESSQKKEEKNENVA